MNILVWKRRTAFSNEGKRIRVHHRAMLNGLVEEVIIPNGDGSYKTTWSGKGFATLPLAKDQVTADIIGRRR